MTALNELAERLRAAGAISSEDVLALRRQVWPDGKIDAGEAELAFALNDAAKAPSREWVDFFVEALCDYVVCQQAPSGYVDAAKAEWLTARIVRDGRVDSLGELELLVKVLEKATNAPGSLKQFALAQIEQTVLTGEGPTRDGGSLDAGVISDAEVKLLRRLLFAQAGDGPGSISQSEAELLFRLKDATLGAANAPGWKTLFVQAVGNHLMAYNSYKPLEAADAARLEAFMDDAHVRIGGFLGRMAGAKFSGFRDVFTSQTKPDRDAAVAAAQAVDPGEAAWLKAKVDSDGAVDALEQALLDFIAEERGQAA
jgi:hypothetical protein